jgi:hypothetical protein
LARWSVVGAYVIGSANLLLTGIPGVARGIEGAIAGVVPAGTTRG